MHKALDTAQKGDVIVVDAGGICENAIIGELMMSRARQRGVAGIVIWGAIRDSAEIGAGTYPVYACAASRTAGRTRTGPARSTCRSTWAAWRCMPGDIIVGDADGLVAVPQEQAERILESAQGDPREGNRGDEGDQAGTVDRSWVDKALREKGYKV